MVCVFDMGQDTFCIAQSGMLNTKFFPDPIISAFGESNLEGVLFLRVLLGILELTVLLLLLNRQKLKPIDNGIY